MKCHKIEKLIYLYRDGELNPNEKKKLDLHLSQCPRCQILYRKLTEYNIEANIKEIQVPKSNLTFEVNQIMQKISDNQTSIKQEYSISLWEKLYRPQVLYSWLVLTCLFILIFSFQQVQFARKLTKLEMQMKENVDNKHLASTHIFLNQILSSVNEDEIDWLKWKIWLDDNSKESIMLSKDEIEILIQTYIKLKSKNRHLVKIIETVCPEITSWDPKSQASKYQTIHLNLCSKKLKHALQAL